MQDCGLHTKHAGVQIMDLSLGMRCAGHVACIRDRSDGYRILVAKPDGKRPLGRSGRR